MQPTVRVKLCHPTLHCLEFRLITKQGQYLRLPLRITAKRLSGHLHVPSCSMAVQQDQMVSEGVRINTLALTLGLSLNLNLNFTLLQSQPSP